MTTRPKSSPTRPKANPRYSVPADNRRAPARPSGAKPVMIEVPDQAYYIGRGLLPRLFGAFAGIVIPDVANEGEAAWVQGQVMKDALIKMQPAPMPPWVGDVSVSSRRVEMSVADARADYRPIVLPRVDDPDALPVPGYADVPGLPPAVQPAPLPVADPLVRGLPERVPSRDVAVVLSIGVSMRPDGEPVITARKAPRRARVLSRARYQDGKYGKKLMGLVNFVVNATWGTVDEAIQLAEALAWNTYVRGPKGPQYAMAKYDGNMAEVLRAYVRGEAKLDTVGFVADYGLSQMGDAFVATILRGVDRAAFRAGWNKPVGMTSSTLNSFVGGVQLEEDGDVSLQSPADALSGLWSGFSEWASSLDVRRQSRVRSLWS